MPQHTDRIDVAVCLCPKCAIPLVLVRPVQGERFNCGPCGCSLQVRGDFVFGNGSARRITYLTER
jgi:hypothetical protein